MKSLFTALMLLACATPAAADPLSISGPVRVVDGDTVVVSGIHVRLKGVDAAELNTDVGQVARQVMIDIVGDSELTCVLTGEHTWKREVGFCFTNDGAIIEQGAALACPRFDRRYIQFEQADALAAQPRASYYVRRR